MTAHELSASYDIAESGILPLSTDDLLAFEEPEERHAILEGQLETPLGYSEASGSLELRTTLANTYRACGPENVLVTTGAIEANFLLFNVLLDPRDHELAESVGAWLLCDEAYRWLEVPGGEPFAPPAFDYGPCAISVGTVSKPFGLPGLRIGWMAAPAEIATDCWAMRDYTSLSPGKLSDALALLAFKHRDRIVERNLKIVGQNLEATNRFVEERSE